MMSHARRAKHNVWATSAAGLALALMLSGCGEKVGAAVPGGVQDAARADGGTGHASVTYRSGTRTMTAQEGMALITGVSSNEAAFLIDGAQPAAKTLAAGDVWFVKEMFARKILAVEAQPDGNILLLTEPAELVDIISDGEIIINQPVNFTSGPGSQAQLLDVFGNVIAPPAYAQGREQAHLEKAEQEGVSEARGKMVSMLTDALIDGWKVTTKPSISKGKLNIDIKLTREVAGLRAVVTVNGHLEGFEFESAIGVQQSRMERIEAGLKKINGVLNVTWEVATDTPGPKTGDHKIKLPASVQIPLSALVDGLPLYLEVSSAIIIQPAMSGGKEYTKGAFRVTYDGVQHFSAKKGVIDSDGHVKGDIEFKGGQNISALAPLGMVVALAAPRVELSFGFNKMLKFSDMKNAAKYVDFIASQAAKRLLSPKAYEAWQNSPFSSIKLGEAIENSMKSDAAAWFQIVTTSSMAHSGFSAITPCERHELSVAARVGANAEAFGQSVLESEKEIFKKNVVPIDPPTAKLCQL